MAPPNPLQNPNTTLRFVVDFAQLDLLQLSPRTYLDVLKNVRAFIRRGQPSSDGDAWIDADLNKAPTLFQERALEILRGIATGQGFTMAGDLVLTFLAVGRGKRVRVVVHGSPLDLFQYEIIRVLEEAGADRLRACPAPNCGRLFVKVTRKRFCSTRCQARIYMQQYRAREDEE